MARHHTQWAAQFAVASELCKLGCDVSFTMGNCTPVADLLVLAPSGRTFLVDVKGLANPNFWQIRQKPPTPDLYYVLTLVRRGAPNRFFPFAQPMLTDLMIAYQHSGVKFDPRFTGINWGAALPHEDNWGSLPVGLANREASTSIPQRGV